MPKKILFADDDPAIRMLLKSNLEARGYYSIGCSDGEQVLETISTQKPDMIILDVKMPGLDGFGIYALLQGTKSLSEIPVIVISGDADMQKLFPDADSMQMKLCINKPFDIDYLMSKVQEIVGPAT